MTAWPSLWWKYVTGTTGGELPHSCVTGCGTGQLCFGSVDVSMHHLHNVHKFWLYLVLKRGSLAPFGLGKVLASLVDVLDVETVYLLC